MGQSPILVTSVDHMAVVNDSINDSRSKLFISEQAALRFNEIFFQYYLSEGEYSFSG